MSFLESVPTSKNLTINKIYERGGILQLAKYQILLEEKTSGID